MVVAPLMPALPVTFLVAGSIQTSDLASRRPMMDAGFAALEKPSEAISAPASAKALVCMCAPVSDGDDRDCPRRRRSELRGGAQVVAVAGESRVRETSELAAVHPFCR